MDVSTSWQIDHAELVSRGVLWRARYMAGVGAVELLFTAGSEGGYILQRRSVEGQIRETDLKELEAYFLREGMERYVADVFARVEGIPKELCRGGVAGLYDFVGSESLHRVLAVLPLEQVLPLDPTVVRQSMDFLHRLFGLGMQLRQEDIVGSFFAPLPELPEGVALVADALEFWSLGLLWDMCSLRKSLSSAQWEVYVSVLARGDEKLLRRQVQQLASLSEEEHVSLVSRIQRILGLSSYRHVLEDVRSVALLSEEEFIQCLTVLAALSGVALVCEWNEATLWMLLHHGETMSVSWDTTAPTVLERFRDLGGYEQLERRYVRVHEARQNDVYILSAEEVAFFEDGLPEALSVFGTVGQLIPGRMMAELGKAGYIAELGTGTAYVNLVLTHQDALRIVSRLQYLRGAGLTTNIVYDEEHPFVLLQNEQRRYYFVVYRYLKHDDFLYHEESHRRALAKTLGELHECARGRSMLSLYDYYDPAMEGYGSVRQWLQALPHPFIHVDTVLAHMDLNESNVLREADGLRLIDALSIQEEPVLIQFAQLLFHGARHGVWSEMAATYGHVVPMLKEALTDDASWMLCWLGVMRYYLKHGAQPWWPEGWIHPESFRQLVGNALQQD